MKFKDKVILITGGDSDLFIATAIYFAKEGALLALVGQNKTELYKISTKIKVLCIEKEPLIIVEKYSECERIIGQTIHKYGHLDILINGSGVGIVGSIMDLNMDDYDRVMSTNLRGVIEMTKYAIPHFTKSKGTIINVSSICSTKPFAGFLAYCMSKAALDQFTKCMAIELASKGIRVNSINIGFNIGDFMSAGQIKRDGDQFIVPDTDSETANYQNKNIEKSVKAIVFFATDHLESFVSGAILPVLDDGVVSLITV